MLQIGNVGYCSGTCNNRQDLRLSLDKLSEPVMGSRLSGGIGNIRKDVPKLSFGSGWGSFASSRSDGKGIAKRGYLK
jgi:hypothetical protein